MRKHIVVISAILLIAGGCSRAATSGGSSPATADSLTNLHRFDDPLLSADEHQAIQVATHAVIDASRPPTDLDRAFRYRVSKRDANWIVTVWRIAGFKGDQPQFDPGGFTTVILDSDFKVKVKMLGE